MKSEIEIICEVVRRLEAIELPYMLTGSVAMNYYAEPRMTRDVDLVLVIENENIQALLSAFSPDYYVEEGDVREAVQHCSMFNLLHLDSVVKIDCIVRKPSKYRRLEFERRRSVNIGDTPVYIVSKEDLILSKLFWAKDSHSEMQLLDVRNLMASGYDHAYVAEWKDELGVSSLLRELEDE